MIYKVFKLRFENGLHIGNGSLEDSESYIYAHTIFSALCLEDISGIENLVNLAKNNKLQISDAFPFIDSVLYLPKPAMPIKFDESIDKKKIKNLKYIPIDSFSSFLEGKLDITKEFKLGKSALQTKVKISSDLSEDAEPYNVGVFKFEEKAGLYFIASFENEEIETQFTNLLTSLSFSGIGGKRSSGFGKFTFEKKEISDKYFSKREVRNKNMTLSSCLPKEDELEKSLENANYSLIKSSGFVYSETYNETLLRKKDLFIFKAGSIFLNEFDGDVYDVSNNGNHPVYKYAKPLFWRF